MKKGISLIILVITIIIMIIIAGAIIMTISQTDIINNTNLATENSNFSAAQSIAMTTYINDTFASENKIISIVETDPDATKGEYASVDLYKAHIEEAIATEFGKDFDELGYTVQVTDNAEHTQITSVKVIKTP